MADQQAVENPATDPRHVAAIIDLHNDMLAESYDSSH